MPLILDDGMDIQYLQWSPQEVMFTDFIASVWRRQV